MKHPVKNFVSKHDTIISSHDTIISSHDTIVSRHNQERIKSTCDVVYFFSPVLYIYT